MVHYSPATYDAWSFIVPFLSKRFGYSRVRSPVPLLSVPGSGLQGSDLWQQRPAGINQAAFEYRTGYSEKRSRDHLQLGSGQYQYLKARVQCRGAPHKLECSDAPSCTIPIAATLFSFLFFSSGLPRQWRAANSARMSWSWAASLSFWSCSIRTTPSFSTWL